jgi:hypothetical protein
MIVLSPGVGPNANPLFNLLILTEPKVTPFEPAKDVMRCRFRPAPWGPNA